MSSIDKAFVKAFSRRGQTTDTQAESSAKVESSAPTTAKTTPSEPGSVQVDPSVAGSASVWIDPIENEIARADHPAELVPKPHVVSTTDAPQVEPPLTAADSLSDTTLNQQLESLQHIHTAYATTGPLPSPVLDPTVGEPLVAAPTGSPEPVVETRIDPPEAHIAAPTVPTIQETITPPARTDQGTTNEERTSSEPPSIAPATQAPEVPTPQTLPAELETPNTETQPIAETSPTAETVPVFDAAVPEPITERAVASEPVVKSTTEPFRAAWEVDVFDVPKTVADLFFEGELFQQIAERMQEAVDTGLRNMLFTSMQAGEGRSSTAIGVAMAAAACGIRVALVDADSQDPTLADDLRLELEHGWLDTIRSGVPLKEVAVHAVEDSLTLFPLTHSVADAAATSYEMGQLLELLRDRFDLVIADGPAGSSASLIQCAAEFDSVVIVRDRVRTQDQVITAISKRFHDAGVKGIGIVENFA